MKKRLYLRLALEGMRKNRRLYLPYLFTCAGMVTVFYILRSLARSPLMATVRGGGNMTTILMLGAMVISLFSLLFLFYTNAFLIRRRNKEFGLYNILGMNKSNISRILFWETLLSALFALIVGLACGLLFSKLAELVLLRMAGEGVDYAFSIEPGSILAALGVFGVIFSLLLLVSLARVRLTNPLDLLKSEAAGEKPPKANWVLAAAGVLLLGAAYFLAVSIESPLTAVMVFFAAVLMVIVATYLLFIAGSVALCKLLQRNKRYYYASSHFVSVSSMAFRMKRNGAGLASICILATMVLVMLSSTSCLYFGGEGSLRGRFPYEMTFTSDYAEPAQCTSDSMEWLLSAARGAAQGQERELVSYTALEAAGRFENGVLDVDGSNYADISASGDLLRQMRSVSILPLPDYNRLAGTDLTLKPGEALVWSSGKPYPCDDFAVKGCRTLRVVGRPEALPFRVSTYETVLVTAYYVIVPDWEAYASEVSDCVKALDADMISVTNRQYCCFDLPADAQSAAAERFRAACRQDSDTPGALRTGVDSRAEMRSDFLTTNGSLFFLGIILSAAFLAAAALIIYYKQLSEGYEDQSRFGIMQKVGMTKREIKSAVDSQVLTVFFAPLLLAGLHLAFAFPFVHKIIRLFGVINTPLLIATSAVCFLVFALFYVFVYRATARAYYAIVSGGDGE